MFAIQSKTLGSMLIIEIEGDVLLPTAIKFETEITDLVNKKKPPEIVLDLSKTEQMDNAAIGVLVTLRTLFSTQGRQLYLFHPSIQVQELIKEIGIEKFFPIFDNAEELRQHRINNSD